MKKKSNNNNNEPPSESSRYSHRTGGELTLIKKNNVENGKYSVCCAEDGERQSFSKCVCIVSL